MTRKLAPQEKQARRPIQKACVFCHEKHLQCDLGRPCQNCSKRSIGNTCRDKQRKPRRSDQKRRKGDVSEPRKRKYTQTTRRLGIARLAMSSSSEPGKSINPENSFISKSGNSSTSFDDFDAKKMDGSIDSMEIFAPERGMESNSESEDDDPDVTSVMPNAVDDVVSTTDEGEKLSPTVPHTPSLLKISPLGKISSLTNLLIPSNEQLFPSSVLVNHSTNNSRLENPGTAPSQDISNKAAMSNVKNSSGSSFGSIWANNEYMKLNDILGSPVIPNNGNGHLQYSLPSDLKMDNYIPEFDSGDSNNNYGLRRSSSRPHISLDMASSSQLINGGLNESVSPEVIEKELSPFKFRQLVKSPEDLYEKRWLIKPHNYRAAYRDLSGYLRQRFLSGEKDSGKTYGSKQLQNIAQSMTTHYSPIFVTLTTNLVENDLEMQELVLQRTLLEYESMAKLTNCTPMCIWRRSGELCYVSNEFVSLTGFSRYDMLSQRRFILEFLDDESVVDYFDIFHERLAFGSKEGIGGHVMGKPFSANAICC